MLTLIHTNCTFKTQHIALSSVCVAFVFDGDVHLKQLVAFLLDQEVYNANNLNMIMNVYAFLYFSVHVACLDGQATIPEP